jgi:hypothetical protein
MPLFRAEGIHQYPDSYKNAASLPGGEEQRLA